jgi:RNA polymerase sigma-70 factor (ECF subfamily)
MRLTMTERSILNKIKQGDDAWIREAYREYRQGFTRWIRKQFLVPEEVAADLFQSALLTLCENVKSGRLTELTSSLQTYLFAIGKNKAHEYLKQQQRQQNISVYDFSLLYNEADEGGQTSESQSLMTQLLDVVSRLGQPCLPLLHLFYYENKSWEEISGMLGYKTVNSAKNMKYKCMQKIKEMMAAVSLTQAH